MKLKRSIIILVAIIALALNVKMPVLAQNGEGQSSYTCVYAHDPRVNAKAMEDIVVNPAAVYGFSPDPESTRLGEYASYDWTDPAVVEKARQDRIKYLADYDSMYELWNQMVAEGKSIEEIAKAVSAKRNEIRLASYANDPEGLAKVKKSNLDTYGNENGPTPESLFEKYGSWEKVLLKAFSSNSGMDACVGLYDVQYSKNVQVQTVVEDSVVTYTIRKGDYLVKIAEKYFGNDKNWVDIYDANKNLIGKDYIIYEGDTLIIPVK